MLTQQGPGTDVLRNLKDVLDSKEQEIFQLKSQLSRPTEDFQYNVKAIDERDSAIARNDNAINSLKKFCCSKECRGYST